MGIQPIDLQILYSQMDKVGRQQEAQIHALKTIAEQNEKENVLESQKKLKSVQEVPQDDPQAIIIHPRNSDGKKNQQPNNHHGSKKQSEENNTNATENYFQDSRVGTKIDISG